MEKKPETNRPDFDVVRSAWEELLKQRGLPHECVWAFDENLCFERDNSKPDGFRLGCQFQMTPPPANAGALAYEYFSGFEHTLVLYRIGTCAGKSVCVMLCDQWFDDKDTSQGYVQHLEWRISFYPGEATTIEEITDPKRYSERILRDRPLHALDFCMTLRAVHEMLAHGYVLSGYEHFALKFLHLWRRALNPQE